MKKRRILLIFTYLSIFSSISSMEQSNSNQKSEEINQIIQVCNDKEQIISLSVPNEMWKEILLKLISADNLIDLKASFSGIFNFALINKKCLKIVRDLISRYPLINIVSNISNEYKFIFSSEKFVNNLPTKLKDIYVLRTKEIIKKILETHGRFGSGHSEEIKKVFENADINQKIGIKHGIYYHFEPHDYPLNIVTRFLHLVIAYEKNEMVELLIKNGADINSTNDLRENALILAIKSGFSNTDYAKIKMVELLIKNGINVNMKNHIGYSALTYAALFNYKEIVKLLLKYGADIFVRDKDNLILSTLLEYINAFKDDYYKEMIDLIKKYEEEQMDKILLDALEDFKEE